MNIALLEKTECTILLHSSEILPHVQDLQKEKSDLQTLTVPSLDDILSQRADHYEYKATFSENCWDPVLILQSSGSTGERS